MGCSSSKEDFSFIGDNYETIDALKIAFQNVGFEKTNLMLAIDATNSNTGAGHYTNSKYHIPSDNLHTIVGDGHTNNQYELVINCITNTLQKYDPDKIIPTYIFGDNHTCSTRVRNIKEYMKDYTTSRRKTIMQIPNGHYYRPDIEYCFTINEVLTLYRELMYNKFIVMSGPTNIAPIINKAIYYSKTLGKDHITLVIIGDGLISPDCEKESINAIVNARKYPISIIMIGVGDGPFDMMKKFDDKIPNKGIDNFQFVDFNKVMSNNLSDYNKFALQCLMEIPKQVKYFKNKKMIVRR